LAISVPSSRTHNPIFWFTKQDLQENKSVNINGSISTSSHRTTHLAIVAIVFFVVVVIAISRVLLSIQTPKFAVRAIHHFQRVLFVSFRESPQHHDFQIS
jgi:hypothetical protein